MRPSDKVSFIDKFNYFLGYGSLNQYRPYFLVLKTDVEKIKGIPVINFVQSVYDPFTHFSDMIKVTYVSLQL